jgi:D-tyrosyl-tRNA(Tyr) deacylase
MRACVQRVSHAAVRVNGTVVGEIREGLLVLLGVAAGDTEQEARLLADKIVHLRIFEDEQGRMNRSLVDVEGQSLVVSQFTLLADCRKGRRPSFSQAAAPEHAEQMYERFSQLIRDAGVFVAQGRFRAEMAVELINQGPVTIWLDTDQLARGGTT